MFRADRSEVLGEHEEREMRRRAAYLWERATPVRQPAPGDLRAARRRPVWSPLAEMLGCVAKVTFYAKGIDDPVGRVSVPSVGF